MKIKNTSILQSGILRVALLTLVLLTIPFVMTQIGDGVEGRGWYWNLSDFIIMGILIFGTGLVFNIVMSKVKDFNQRIIIGTVILSVFLLIWAELAVGIFGTPFAGS